MKNLLTLSFVCLIFTACARPQSDQPITQLQTREMQSRLYDTDNTKLVMKSMMNVLQDEGFMVKNAVFDLGLISAEKNINVENKTKAFFNTVLMGANARWDKQQILEASANVSDFGNQTRIRMNFQTKTLDNMGCPIDVVTVSDMDYYQKFFDKVSKAIFLQEQNI